MNEEYPAVFKEIANFIEEYDDFLVTAHFSPDGDAVGSCLGFASILNASGKKATVALEGGMPDRYAFLTNPGHIIDPKDVERERKYKNVVVLDIGSYNRIGHVTRIVADEPNILNIDHHPSNDGLGKVSYLDGTASSVCEIIYYLAKYLKIDIDPNIATYLYTGIMTDTGRFRFSNTTPTAFCACGELVKCGADPATITESVYFDLPRENIVALGKALNSLTFHGDGRLAVMEYLESPEIVDAEGFIDFALGIKSAQAAVFIRVLSDDRYKVSLRARDALDVKAIAEKYDGGGHSKAAGFRYRGDLEALKKELVTVMLAGLDAI